MCVWVLFCISKYVNWTQLFIHQLRCFFLFFFQPHALFCPHKTLLSNKTIKQQSNIAINKAKISAEQSNKILHNKYTTEMFTAFATPAPPVSRVSTHATHTHILSTNILDLVKVAAPKPKPTEHITIHIQLWFYAEHWSANKTIEKHQIIRQTRSFASLTCCSPPAHALARLFSVKINSNEKLFSSTT